MSVRVSSKIWRHSTASGNPLIVLLALADSASDDGIVWAFETTLAEKSRLSTRRVRAAIRELEDAREIETRKAQRGRRRQNVYRILVGDPLPIDYDRLPFELVEPFSDDRTKPPVVDSDERGDDRTETVATTGRPRPVVDDFSSIRDPLKDPLEETSAELALRDEVETPETRPPKLTKIDGQDIAFNALAETTGVDVRGNRAREVALALNGGGAAKLTGIREMFARQLRDHGRPDLADGGEAFERALVDAIAMAANRYRGTMPPGSKLTPLALAKWWMDLRHAQQRTPPRRYGYGLTTEEILAIPIDELDEHVQRLNDGRIFE